MADKLGTLGTALTGYWGTLGYYLEGTPENDVIHGSDGNDSIYGLAGRDTLYGAGGNDLLDGGAGNDVLDGGLGADTLNGGDGTDTASYNTAASGVTLDLTTGEGYTGAAQGDRYISIENVFGSSYGDIINGDFGANRLEGSAGDDWLFGNGGADTLVGGAGDDILRGGSGSDRLVGGVGVDIMTGNGERDISADTFVLLRHGGPDVITDFQEGVDTIALSGFTTADLGRNGELAIGRIGQDTGRFFGSGLDSGDHLFFNTETNELWEINPQFINGQLASLGTIELIATLTNGATIHTFDLDFI